VNVMGGTRCVASVDGSDALMAAISITKGGVNVNVSEDTSNELAIISGTKGGVNFSGLQGSDVEVFSSGGGTSAAGSDSPGAPTQEQMSPSLESAEALSNAAAGLNSVQNSAIQNMSR
jgi:hypothetical protein